MIPTRYQRAMQEINAQTRPHDLAVRRCREQLESDLPPLEERPRPWPQPDPRAVRRVRWRLRHARQTFLYGPLLGTFVVVTTVFVLWFGVLPAQLNEPVESPVTSLTLSSQGAASLSPAPYLDVHYTGEGQLVGQGASWHVHWQRGKVQVELDPNALREVHIHTAEAHIEVIGTVFDVARDTLGTKVTVERGLVRVTCRQSQETLTLTADDEHICWPTTPTGLLARAIYLGDRDAPVETQLATLDAGLGMSKPEEPVYGEMLSSRMTTLLSVDRKHEALDAARRYLELNQPPRETTVRDVAVQLAVLVGTCKDAKTLAVAGREPLSADAMKVLENCP